MVAAMKVRRVIEVDVPGLGARIRAAREADERSLTQICAAVGMTTANWYKIEKEETKFLPDKTLKNIERVLGVSLGVDMEGDRNV